MKFLTIFEQKVLHIQFALGLGNAAADSDKSAKGLGGGTRLGNPVSVAGRHSAVVFRAGISEPSACVSIFCPILTSLCLARLLFFIQSPRALCTPTLLCSECPPDNPCLSWGFAAHRAPTRAHTESGPGESIMPLAPVSTHGAQEPVDKRLPRHPCSGGSEPLSGASAARAPEPLPPSLPTCLPPALRLPRPLLR